VSVLKRSVLVVIVAVGLLVLSGVARAVAAEPWWHVNTISAPAISPGGEGRLVVEVSNLGDAMVNATEHNVTVVDKLPAGVNATHVYGEGGGGSLGKSIGHPGSGPSLPCSIAGQAATGQTVSCMYGWVLLAYERFMIAITVTVEPGAGSGVNEVNVSGGDAPPVVSRRALALGESAPPYGAENYELTPEDEGGAPDTQAGSHPFQLTTTLTFNTKAVPVKYRHGNELRPEVQPVGLTKDLRFDTPPGLVGNPTPLSKCSLYVFVHDFRECPADTVVGVSTPIVTDVDNTTNVPLAATFPLYNLEPAVGEPARFGFPTPIGQVILDTSVSAGGNEGGYHVVVTVPDITDQLVFIGSQLTFWGVPADPRHDTARGTCLATAAMPNQVFQTGELSCPVQEKLQPFLVLPTSCSGPPRTTVQGDSWEHIGEYSPPKEYVFANLVGEPYGLDGCDRLSFEPSISLTPDGQQASAPTGLTVGVHVPQDASLNPSGLAESALRSTTVALPAGVTLNPAAADGLESCTAAQLGLESPVPISCPEASKVGTVEIATPLLPTPLVGAAYLGAQEANPFGSLIALYMVVENKTAGVLVKLAGEVKPDPVTGQLVATFKETPEVPFEDLRLHFFGGSRAPLGTPALCGGYTTTALFAPWAGGTPVDSSSVFQITSGANGGACSDPLPFAPELTTGSLNIQAGAFSPFTMTMSRGDGDQNLDAIQLKMPPGLLGTLSSVKLCEEAQANTGTCGPESLIGETTVSVGVGGTPYTVKGGRVYITGPYNGAPYGLSIVNPAKAGPFDLEKTRANHPACDCLVVRAKIEVDPTNAAITVTSDTTGSHAIPTILEGIPLQIKHVNVTIDRPGFIFNPTNCSPMQIGGSLTSSQGAISTLHVPFQVTNCAILRFKPIFSVSTSGHTSRADGASLHVKLTYPKAPFGTQANIGKVKVDLPKQLPSRLTTLQKACPDSVFNANPAACPPNSRVGSATATTPVLPVHLEGPAYFVSHGGAKFPELIIALSGEGVTVYLHGETFISKAGITSSTFRTIPDVPIGTFELTLPQGPDSALAANGNLCTSSLRMPTMFVAANGMRINQSTPITATGCARHKKKAKRSRVAHHAKHSHK
jgi:uncharacterized repeat protein (TIGR01451 family)